MNNLPEGYKFKKENFHNKPMEMKKSSLQAVCSFFRREIII
ncbi:MAG: hypothetical protein ABRQ37_11065 [Candidatus Eremiobacterota bacterium]